MIFPRQGPVAFQPQMLRNVDSLTGAANVSRKWADWRADACFVDSTGGFGAGWIDQLSVLGRDAVGIHFAGKALNPGRYANKRAEMWFEMCQWIREGGILPNIPELVEELTAPTYSFHKDTLLLEPKEAIKARIGRSPDYADALALTFAYPVAAPEASVHARDHAREIREQRAAYDPYAVLQRRLDPYSRLH